MTIAKLALVAGCSCISLQAFGGDVNLWFTHQNADPTSLPTKNIGNEVFYQIVVDRFANGNQGNDCVGDASFCDPTHRDWYAYWGGDLRGIISNLPYLKDLGATHLWLTPIFANNQVKVGGPGGAAVTPYHGYWIRDWFRLESHFTDTGDRDFGIVQELVEKASPELHVVLDTVINHSSPANATSESLSALDAAHPLNRSDGVKRTYRGAVFRDGDYVASLDEDLQKDGKGPAHFHHFGPITDFNNQFQVENYQLDGLTDIDQFDETMHSYLHDAHNFWLRQVPGLAGYRMDTVKHVNINYWQQFDRDFFAANPDKQIIGEYFGGGPGDPATQRFYNTTHMSVFDFEFHYAMVDLFVNHAPMSRLTDLWARDPALIDARSLVTFIDNHDLPRLRGLGATREAMRQALALLLVSRGVPCLYYGIEQDLFTPGDSGDPYNRPMMRSFATDGDLYKLVKQLSALRRSNSALRYGLTHVVHESDQILAFERVDGNNRVLLVMSKNPIQGSDNFDLNGLTLPDGEYRDVLTQQPASVHSGKLHVSLRNGSLIVLSSTAVQG